MCLICDIIKNGDYIYKDELIAIIPSPNPSCKGHFLVVPTNHFVILEQLDDHLFATMFITANRLATMLYELLNAEGTNIIVRNGVTAGQIWDHVAVEVLPRYTQDNLNLTWKSKQKTKEELNKDALELRNALVKFETKKEVKNDEDNNKKVNEEKRDFIRLSPRIP